MPRSQAQPASTAASASPSPSPPFTVAAGSLTDFRALVSSTTRILALLGAGLSAASGLPTFRGAGGMWKNYAATQLATPQAFRADPGLVWQFYSYRRHMALKAKPNLAHYALAELARRKEDFVTLSQNVDGLSQRAGHPPDKLHLLHGNLFDIKCFNRECDYLEVNYLKDPIVPALAATTSEPEPSSTDRTGKEATTSLFNAMSISSSLATGSSRINPSLQSRVNMLDSNIQNQTIPESELPHCPRCNSLLRPGVVWFGESLSKDMLETIDQWIDEAEKIDLMLVIGTAASVYPAANYILQARGKGARIAVINMDSTELGATGTLRTEDFMFVGDSGVIVPYILKEVIEELDTQISESVRS